MTEVSPASTLMPDLSRRARLTRHDVWSAVASLTSLGVPAERVVLRYAGGGWDVGSIVGQQPPAGTALSETSRIVLDVGGTGTLESLPYSLRQDSSAGEMLVDRVCAVLDGPLIRGRANVRSAGGRYRLSPGDTRVARRWIEEVMQLSASDWPEHLWYRVARFLSSLPIVAGRHDAIAIALGFVYGLEVSRIELRTNRLPIERSLATRLGTHNGRLGIDTVAGDGLLWPHSIAVTIGPVSLETYLEQRGWQAGRASLYALVVPAFVPGGVSERWVVEPRADGYRLGARDQAPLLGVSSYLS